MTIKLFDDEASYRRQQIREKLGAVSDRTLDTLLRDVPRIALSRKLVLYPGRDLNELVERAAERGTTPSAPTGACARAAKAS